MAADVGMNCRIDGKADPALRDVVCLEIADALASAYPDRRFVTGGSGDTLSVDVIFRNATPSGVGLHLVWTTADGRRLRGEILAVSSMDRPVSSGQRASLYRRVIAATPIPE